MSSFHINITLTACAFIILIGMTQLLHQQATPSRSLQVFTAAPERLSEPINYRQLEKAIANYFIAKQYTAHAVLRFDADMQIFLEAYPRMLNYSPYDIDELVRQVLGPWHEQKIDHITHIINNLLKFRLDNPPETFDIQDTSCRLQPNCSTLLSNRQHAVDTYD